MFHTRSALTQEVWPLREALVHMMIGGQHQTYIWKDDNGDAVGFAQLSQGDDDSQAYILCLGSTLPDDGLTPESEHIWISLLEELVEKVGSKRIHGLIAEVNELGDELPILRRAGFAVYTRQDIWRLEEIPDRFISPLRLHQAEGVDEWDITLLYRNVVPRLIQLVEPAPSGEKINDIWVLREEGELTAFVVFTKGTTGTWMRIFVHPNSHARTEDIFKAAVTIVSEQKEKMPIYCCVRRYQSWVQSGLQTVGFEQMGSQAMMVRHTVNITPRKHVSVLSKEVREKAVAARQNWLIGEAGSRENIHRVTIKNGSGKGTNGTQNNQED
ncbi:MAG: hypothetical protein AAF633_11120 [Chloroflexota bacterium]